MDLTFWIPIVALSCAVAALLVAQAIHQRRIEALEREALCMRGLVSDLLNKIPGA